MRLRPAAVVLLSAVAAMFGQQTQSASSFNRGTKGGEETVEIRNVAFELTGTGIPGRPRDQRLVLRTTLHSTQIVGDIGVDSKITLEAWPMGAAFTQKPIYSVTLDAHDARTVEGAVWFVGRGEEDVEWWSVLKLGSGQHLFDSYVPPLFFTVSRETVRNRYVGLDVPVDDVKDARLKEPHIVGLVEYASEDKMMREVLITCDDLEQAAIIRGLEDTTRTLMQAERSLTISFSDNAPSPPNVRTIRIPVVNDDLDLAHAQLPKGLHLTVFRR